MKTKINIKNNINQFSTINNSLLHNPVGWWRMDENVGLYAYDSSGKCNHGIMINMDGSNWQNNINRKIGTALLFNGIDEYIDCGKHSSLNIINDITISAWIKLNSLAGYFISKNTAAAADSQYAIFIDNGGFLKYYPTSVLTSAVGSISTGVWIHIILIRINGTGQFYVNGIASGGSAAIAMPSRDTEINIGRRQPSDYHLNGIIDDVRIFNRALSLDEVKCLARLGT